MPNTDPPLDTADALRQYRKRVMRRAPEGFQPLLCLYLTTHTNAETIRTAHEAGAIAAKLYPRGATTNSTHGIPLDKMQRLNEAFGAMEDLGMVLCLHGEDPDVYVMHRERAFLQEIVKLALRFPRLRMVIEHVSTEDMVRYVLNAPQTVAATITPHHLILTLDDVVGGKLRPHHFCMPVAKSPEDRDALIRCATSGNSKFFAGTDTAPHARDRKECAEGCAGIFNAPVAIPIYAQVFEEAGALANLERFLSGNGAEFYGLGLNGGTMRLIKRAWGVPASYGTTPYIPLFAGQTLAWQIAR
jgi:dihydroorotase